MESVRATGAIGLTRRSVVRLALDAVPTASEKDAQDAIFFLLSKNYVSSKTSALDAGEERLILTAAGFDVLDSAENAA